MRRSGKGSGGGLGMNKNVRPGVRTGERAREMREKGVSQIGSSQANRAMNSAKKLNPVEPVRGQLKPAGAPGGVPLGNEVAKNVGKGGCGTGRVLYGQSGTQAMHGPANPGRPTPTRDILNSFGPDSAGVRARR